MKSLSILFLVASLSGFAGTQAQAKPPFLNIFRQTYALKSGTPLEQAKCMTCHVAAGPPVRNPYGSMVEQALRAANTQTLTPAILRRLEAADADGDGWTNGAEIAAGTLPGNPQSHPDGSPPSGPAKQNVPAAEPSKTPLIPLHSFHPILVHFPIALFIFGGLIEGWGAWKRRPTLREAGFLCLTGASLISPAAVATGLIALYRNGFAFQGIVLIHLSLAVSATAGMATTVLLGRAAARAGKERGGGLYWLALVVSLLLVSATGHFGSLLVYGT